MKITREMMAMVAVGAYIWYTNKNREHFAKKKKKKKTPFYKNIKVIIGGVLLFVGILLFGVLYYASGPVEYTASY